MRSTQNRPSGFSLVELVLAMSIMTILVGSMGSAVLIASRAIPDADDLSERKAAATEAVDRIGRDLELATSVSQADPWVFDGYVPDRGHGLAGPESVRYDWSGTPGDPLMIRYNSLVENDVVCENVHDFSLEYHRVVRPLTQAPRVLMIVGDDQTPDAQDQARRTEIESWGFQVEIIDPFAGDAAYKSELADADVMYWSEQHTTPPPWWVFDAGRGIVCEKMDSLGVLGISKTSNWHWYSVLQIVDNTHEITSVFPVGPVQIFSSDQYGITSTNSIAPDGQILGGNSGYDIMVAVEIGGDLYGGKTAPARRVSMPWGDKDFDFTTVTDDGLTIMRRAITWAAAPVVISGATITVQVGPDASGRVVSDVQLLNLPGAP